MNQHHHAIYTHVSMRVCTYVAAGSPSGEDEFLDGGGMEALLDLLEATGSHLLRHQVCMCVIGRFRQGRWTGNLLTPLLPAYGTHTHIHIQMLGLLLDLLSHNAASAIPYMEAWGSSSSPSSSSSSFHVGVPQLLLDMWVREEARLQVCRYAYSLNNPYAQRLVS